jgi:hypothetical protein
VVCFAPIDLAAVLMEGKRVMAPVAVSVKTTDIEAGCVAIVMAESFRTKKIRRSKVSQ